MLPPWVEWHVYSAAGPCVRIGTVTQDRLRVRQALKVVNRRLAMEYMTTKLFITDSIVVCDY
jgi:hypothetical protein